MKILNKFTQNDKNANWLIIVAALGYFVDIYDLVLFGIVRQPSLIDLGITSSYDLQYIGAKLLNLQMLGMLCGGIFWGVLGDKKGRLNVLFGSIITYSIANLLNAGIDKVTFMDPIRAYEILRFIAGFGLAGELGVGITLVSESMSKETRGYGTMIVAGVGISGAIFANIVHKITNEHWQTVYFVGGILGFLLLLLRIGVYESKMFTSIKNRNVKQGDFLSLFKTKKILLKYFSIILVAVPVWYVVGILMIFAPELGKFMGMKILPTGGDAIMYCYIGITIGDFASGYLSQIIKSRKKAMLLFLLSTIFFTFCYFIFAFKSLFIFYLIATLIGFSTGYWAVFVTTSAELFGTNIRATVATTAPNFVRGFVVLITGFYLYLNSFVTQIQSAIIVGIVVYTIGLIALYFLEETFNKDLNYTEEI